MSGRQCDRPFHNPITAPCCPVSEIWRGAAGQGLIVCRTWGFADNQSGQFPKAGNSLPNPGVLDYPSNSHPAAFLLQLNYKIRTQQ